MGEHTRIFFYDMNLFYDLFGGGEFVEDMEIKAQYKGLLKLSDPLSFHWSTHF